jgi:hypothetical protein
VRTTSGEISRVVTREREESGDIQPLVTLFVAHAPVADADSSTRGASTDFSGLPITCMIAGLERIRGPLRRSRLLMATLDEASVRTRKTA